jgi:hypothetical protein
MEALFHLGNDPGEQHAIAGEHAQVRAALSALLDGQKRSQAGDISTTEVDASTLEVLKAMGYVGDEE